MSQPILGCIADDLTGATDLCNNLVRSGMRVVLTVDVPRFVESLPADAIVVALKSRTIEPAEAAAQSLAACRWLRNAGVRQIYFKICSTFDSTRKGNIGPVIEALMDELNCDFSAVVPSFPDNERTVFRGHLFVGDVLLSESGMRDHPLTPMTDANLVRFLGQQLHGNKQRKAGLIDYRVVSESADAIRKRIDSLRSAGISVAIADSISNDDVLRLGEALSDHVLVTAGSGLAIGLPRRWGMKPSAEAAHLPETVGRRAIISGSCSIATNAQVEHFIHAGGNAYSIDPIALERNTSEHIERAISWANALWDHNPEQMLLVYSTAKPAALKTVHEQLGVEQSGELVESALSQIARALVWDGVGQLVVAGGETAGVCIRALDMEQVQIGRQIDPGVPWCYGSSPLARHRGIHLALKSGNFGTNDFFIKAFRMLEQKNDD